jgi:hypothetical protein
LGRPQGCLERISENADETHFSATLPSAGQRFRSGIKAGGPESTTLPHVSADGLSTILQTIASAARSAGSACPNKRISKEGIANMGQSSMNKKIQIII